MADTIFERHQHKVLAVLDALDKSPKRHVELTAVWFQKGGSLPTFNKLLKWLKSNGYIEKSEPSEHTSPYEITMKGKKYLAGLKA